MKNSPSAGIRYEGHFEFFYQSTMLNQYFQADKMSWQNV